MHKTHTLAIDLPAALLTILRGRSTDAAALNEAVVQMLEEPLLFERFLSSPSRAPRPLSTTHNKE